MIEQETILRPVKKFRAGRTTDYNDVLACEAPLEIRLVYGPPENEKKKSISVTMRTPGDDFGLGAGFLFTEGILQKDKLISPHLISEHILEIGIGDAPPPDLNKLERNFYTTSSCGVCGKSSIDAIRTAVSPAEHDAAFTVPAEMICALPALLREGQEVFGQTGGLHASALFDKSGKLLLVREDVGRHNALDKLVGYYFLQHALPLNEHILLLSGRASFELIQKAAMSGIRIIASVGAPSSLAVELAEEFDMTL